MQKLGQHFLKNQAVVQKIISALELAPNDTIIELGAGHGELTLPLVETCAGIGCKVIAIEKDQELTNDLKHSIQIIGKNIEVIRADIRDYLKSFSQSYILPPKADPPRAENSKFSYKLVGNIPYYLTGYLLRLVSELPAKPARAVLMVQQEVAERICAQPKVHPVRGREDSQRPSASHGMNRLAASVQFWAHPRIIAAVPKEDFDPQPKIDSAVVSFALRKPQFSHEDAARYYKIVRALFSQPRKTILNNLQAHYSSPKEEIISIIRACGADPAARPQNLSAQEIVALARKLF